MTELEAVVSYSELDTFYQCPLRWRWQYAERWNVDKAVAALDRGTVWHAMLQTHYELARLKADSEERSDAVQRCMMSGDLGPEENDLLWWMYCGYVECYGKDPEYDWLATEITRTIPLPDPDDPSRPGRYGLKVKIDGVTRNRRTGQLLAWDHKTGGDFTPLNRLEWRPQFPLYTWVLRAAGLDVFGFVVNAARTKRNQSPMTFDQRYRRNFLLFNDRQLLAFAVEAAKAAAAMHDPGRIEYAAPRDLVMGACTFCDYDGAHRQVMRGIDEEVALKDLGFVRGYDRPELKVIKPV